MFDTDVKLEALDYRVTTLLLAILLVILLWRIYKNYMKPYAEFPTFPFIRHILYCAVTNKIPKHLPITSFFFQELVRIGMRFQTEGVLLAWLPEPILAIFDKEAVKALSNDPTVLDKAHIYRILRMSLGTGLLTSNGEKWKTNRKLLDPAFHVGMLKKKVPIVNESAKMLVKKMEECMGESSIDVIELLKPCAFGNICESVLGLKMNIPENKEIIKKFVDQVTNFGSIFNHRIKFEEFDPAAYQMLLLDNITELAVTVIAYPWLYFMYSKLRFAPLSKNVTKIMEDMRSFTREIISEMRKNIILQQANRPIGDDWNEDDETRKSFAHILLDHHLKDNSFTMKDVEDQVITFMVTGYDSVSYTLLFILFMLGHHPEVQEQAYNEVDTLEDGNIKYEDLHKLKYLECVIKETLRIYPTVPLYARTLSKDTPCGKYNVPKGTDILFIPYLMHRDPEVFPDPEKFDPCRFMGGGSSKMAGSYIPFSEGIRHCIGKRFAMMEMKVLISYILRNFQVMSLDRREDVNISWRIVNEPLKPLRFRFKLRD